jgi:hypothetical protein
MLEADEQAGRDLIPVSTAYYAVQRLRCGRRSYSSSTTDVLSPRAQCVNGLSVVSTDESVGAADDGDDLCLGDLLACRRDDPATAASRDLDWDAFLTTLDDRKRGIVHNLAVGHSMKSMAAALKVSAPRVTQIKDEIGKEIRFRMGDQVLADAVEQPLWRHSLRARQTGRQVDRGIPPFPKTTRRIAA